MPDKQETTPSRNLGLIGTLKIAAATLVFLFAGLAILLVMDTISRDQFNEYIITLFTVVFIGTIAGVVIALLIRPGK